MRKIYNIYFTEEEILNNMQRCSTPLKYVIHSKISFTYYLIFICMWLWNTSSSHTVDVSRISDYSPPKFLLDVLIPNIKCMISSK